MGPVEWELVFCLFLMKETELASKIFSERTPEFLSKTMPPLTPGDRRKYSFQNVFLNDT
jgi:hypothetical protein